MSSTDRPTPPVIRRGARADAASVARLHATQISEGFLSLLGPKFLERLYRRICDVPTAFVLVAVEHGSTVGFVAGSTDVPGLYRQFLLRDGAVAAVGSAGRILRQWRRVLETLRHGSGVGTGQGMELLAIAVSSAVRGRGIGRQLVAAFLDEAAAGGEQAAYVVVAADNRAAIALYRRAGFSTVEEVELHAGTASLVMQWDGAAPSSDGTPN